VPSILGRWGVQGGKADLTLPVVPTFVFDLPKLAPNAESPRAKPGLKLKGSHPTGLGSAWMPGGEVTVSHGPATLSRDVFTRSLGIGAKNRRFGVAGISVAARDMAMPKSQVNADLLGGSQTAAARSLPFVDAVLQESRSEAEFSGSEQLSRTRLSNRERPVQKVEPFRRPGSALGAPWMARSAVGTQYLDREGHESTRKRTKPERTSDVFRSFPAVSWPSRSTGLNRPSEARDLRQVGDDPGRTGLVPEATFGRSVPLLPVREPWSAFSLREGDESAGSARTNPFRQGHVQTGEPGAVVQARAIDGSTSFAFVRVPNEATVVVPRQGPVIGPHRMLRLSSETRLLGGEARRTKSRADSEMPIDRRRPGRAFETVRPTGVLPRDALRGAAELTQVRARRHDDFLPGRIDSLAVPMGQSAAQFAFTVERHSGNEEPIARRAGRQIANPGGLLPLAMAGPIDQAGEVGPRRSAAETPKLGRSRATSVATSSPVEVARRTASSYSPGPVLPLVSQSASHGSPAVAAAGSESRTVGATITPHSSAASTKSTVVQRFGDGSEAESNPSMGSTDLDTLARQVYAMLKQRLVVERERIGLRGGRRSW